MVDPAALGIPRPNPKSLDFGVPDPGWCTPWFPESLFNLMCTFSKHSGKLRKKQRTLAKPTKKPKKHNIQKKNVFSNVFKLFIIQKNFDGAGGGCRRAR